MEMSARWTRGVDPVSTGAWVLHHPAASLWVLTEAFEQAQGAYQLAQEKVLAYKDAEKGAEGPAAVMAAKGATAKAELEAMKAEINYRVAHAKLTAAMGRE